MRILRRRLPLSRIRAIEARSGIVSLKRFFDMLAGLFLASGIDWVWEEWRNKYDEGEKGREGRKGIYMYTTKLRAI